MKKRALWGRLQNAGFFWLSRIGLLGLLPVLFVYQSSWIDPDAERYFESSKQVMAQSFANRARQYLLDSIEAFDMSNGIGGIDRVETALDPLYSMLNTSLYRENYACTEVALNHIDNLYFRLNQQSEVSNASYVKALIPAFRCLETIEAGQNVRQAEVINRVAWETVQQRNLTLWLMLAIVVMGVFFGLLHRRYKYLLSKNELVAQEWQARAMYDGLTGILNRRAFNSDFAQLIVATDESKRQFSLLMCDIDEFKKYNDTMGHQKGDAALKAIAEGLLTALRASDRLYRYGGEEMVILLRDTDESAAEQVGLRVLNTVRSLTLEHPASESGFLSISIGCAVSQVESADHMSVLNIADSRLYQAKGIGRDLMVSSGNRVLQ